MRAMIVLCLAFLTACGGGGGITGPSEIQEPITVQLQAPVKLKGQWATAAQAPYVPGDHNVVVISPSYAKDDPASVAKLCAERRLPVIVFAGFIYGNKPNTWANAWVNFEKYIQHFKDAGVLVGIQPLDEPAHNGQWNNVIPAVADVRARGYRVLLTEVVSYVDKEGFYKLVPPRVDWFHVTCYPYPQTRWNLETCGQEYNESPEWDVAILDNSWSNAPEWVQMAESKHRGWLLWRE